MMDSLKSPVFSIYKSTPRPSTHMSSNQFQLKSLSFTMHMQQEAKVQDRFSVSCDIIIAIQTE